MLSEWHAITGDPNLMSGVLICQAACFLHRAANIDINSKNDVACQEFPLTRMWSGQKGQKLNAHAVQILLHSQANSVFHSSVCVDNNTRKRKSSKQWEHSSRIAVDT